MPLRAVSLRAMSLRAMPFRAMSYSGVGLPLLSIALSDTWSSGYLASFLPDGYCHISHFAIPAFCI